MDYLEGKAWVFGDFISTDLIAPGRYFHLRSNLPEFSKHVLEDANPDFPRLVQPGDIVVAGKNFGMGSSREHAPAIMKLAGVSAVLAESFSRIFFRNAINIGLPAIAVPSGDFVAQGERLRIDLVKGIIYNLDRDREIHFNPLAPFMINILNDGGVVDHVIKHKGFQI
ncbi:3-isopropylmalate/(R)-2-methylmalate dehydratase small subunit [Desulfotomaculum arcticum]|uniref:3-isopropylmalate dehydratase small subunit n=1 Tax=Desulfotruncus arcticus DSM 17038 TaxID=1121424 RepID=A0A1I2PEY8_9FIRM|nr:3-isopropylmalate dehydratase [Desulfotruncus arcticus]SFG14658.1 3-isopropylmalate/(R)-2-methylmalate dehydratase small subunit [Desulfotomaculum arcticum] [Desulfotruncus arcticus DSM 17038]